VADQTPVERAGDALLTTQWDLDLRGHRAHSTEHYTPACPLCRPDYEGNRQRIAHAVLAGALVVDELARVIGEHAPADAEPNEPGWDCVCGAGHVWSDIDEANRHVADAVRAHLLDGAA
jgi:hypothetical protein